MQVFCFLFTVHTGMISQEIHLLRRAASCAESSTSAMEPPANRRYVHFQIWLFIFQLLSTYLEMVFGETKQNVCIKKWYLLSLLVQVVSLCVTLYGSSECNDVCEYLKTHIFVPLFI